MNFLVSKEAKNMAKRHRQLLKNKAGKFYLHRNPKGQFRDLVRIGKSLKLDRKRKAITKIKAGRGEHGDR